jgi:hypothetical protein
LLPVALDVTPSAAAIHVGDDQLAGEADEFGRLQHLVEINSDPRALTATPTFSSPADAESPFRRAWAVSSALVVAEDNLSSFPPGAFR